MPSIVSKVLGTGVVEPITDALESRDQRKTRQAEVGADIQIALSQERVKEIERFSKLELAEIQGELNTSTWRPKMMHTIRHMWMALFALPFLDVFLTVVSSFLPPEKSLAGAVDWTGVYGLAIEPLMWVTLTFSSLYVPARTIEKMNGASSGMVKRLVETGKEIFKRPDGRPPAQYRRQEAEYVPMLRDRVSDPVTPAPSGAPIGKVESRLAADEGMIDLGEPAGQQFDRKEVTYQPRGK